ncbi:MAG: hypothetical protein CMK99_10900 [Pseudomonas sp.]|nr:hypothetical protein [Pseudomonas sp.]MBK61329.1 hypothetical protein [Pseudomonas sp.]HBS77682.1 hypothetical protein [Pseudomonas sp.]
MADLASACKSLIRNRRSRMQSGPIAQWRYWQAPAESLEPYHHTNDAGRDQAQHESDRRSLEPSASKPNTPNSHKHD